jgi:hypothetical protein
MRKGRIIEQSERENSLQLLFVFLFDLPELPMPPQSLSLCLAYLSTSITLQYVHVVCFELIFFLTCTL